ncbi:MAG: cytochrome P450 [Acidimicrobiia bacterium]
MRPERDPAAGLMLELTDPPGHGRLRRVIHEFFQPAAVARLEKRVTEFVDTALEVDGRVDVPNQLGGRLAADVLGLLTGAEPDTLPWLIDRAAHAFEQPDGTEPALALRELFMYCGRLVRTPKPSNGAPRTIVEALARAPELGLREVAANCVNIIAGAATIRNAVNGAVVALAGQPDRWEQLAATPALLDAAVDELCRYVSPALHVARTTVTPTTLAGARLDAGDVVTVWLVSANRDEAMYARPDDLLLERSPNPHLAFATGPHACIGVHLARSVLRCFVHRLVSQFEPVDAAGAPRYLASSFVSSVTNYEATFDRRRRIS